ncbi:MAG: hypothetical protein PF518_18755 [Spirochaetaceae bacterium]|nr:hypothetical protein [Spirochaetaceae bacterium]
MIHEGIMGIKELDEMVEILSKRYTTVRYSGMKNSFRGDEVRPVDALWDHEYIHKNGLWGNIYIPVGENMYLKFYYEG